MRRDPGSPLWKAAAVLVVFVLALIGLASVADHALRAAFYSHESSHR